MSPDRPAIVAADGTFTYQDLDDASHRVASALLGGSDDLAEARVAFLVPPSCAWVAVRQGIWRAGGVAVPLAISHPAAELEYTIRDSGARYIVAHPSAAALLAPIAARASARLRRRPTELLADLRSASTTRSFRCRTCRPNAAR